MNLLAGEVTPCIKENGVFLLDMWILAAISALPASGLQRPPTLNVFFFGRHLSHQHAVSPRSSLEHDEGWKQPRWRRGGQGRRRGCGRSQVIPVTPPRMCRVLHGLFISLPAGTQSRNPEDRGGAWVHCILVEHIAKLVGVHVTMPQHVSV